MTIELCLVLVKFECDQIQIKEEKVAKFLAIPLSFIVVLDH